MNLFKKIFKNKIKDNKIFSICKGTYKSLNLVKDFYDKDMGVGYAIEIDKNQNIIDVLAPFDSKIETIFPSKHALTLTSENGLKTLIHIGVETVKLNGEGFKQLVQKGENVKRGQKLISVDLKVLTDSDLNTDIMFVVLNENWPTPTSTKKINWNPDIKDGIQVNSDTEILSVEI
ncbi:PTS sugar transporter subunit IIA [Mycoplasma leonicaptivi]|uniref:PTS sugar transporter subunit IIA n=1 Tax=Mycoplasma leonicaptivi TaxID=36742 RepID=UPI00068559AC|nr:PTS glucose transporter subunit IIA [Mycoplasma leonicaptivi]